MVNETNRPIRDFVFFDPSAMNSQFEFEFKPIMFQIFKLWDSLIVV